SFEDTALEAGLEVVFDATAPATCGAAHVSGYTAGHWCQVLPADAFLSLGEPTDFSSWRLLRDGNGDWRIDPNVTLTGRKKLADPAVKARPDQWSLFNWIVVTRAVSSGDGSSDHEAYVGVLEPKDDGSGDFRMLGADINPAGSFYFGRILDMQ